MPRLRPRTSESRLAEMQAEMDASTAAFEEPGTMEEMIQRAAQTDIGKRILREGKREGLVARQIQISQGQTESPEEYLEKLGVYVNLKAKAATHGLANQFWRANEAVQADPSVRKVSQDVADYSHQQVDEANEAAESLQPDPAMRLAGFITEQGIANAPSLIATGPASGLARTGVGLVQELRGIKHASNLAKYGDAAFTTHALSKAPDYEKLARTIALTAAGTTSGGMEGLSTWDEVRMRLEKQGVSPEEAKAIATPQAIADGFAAAAITMAFGTKDLGGIESVLNNPTGKAKLVKSGGKYLKAFFGEGAEEGSHSLVSSALDRMVSNPDLTLEQALQQAATEFIVGGVFGGGVHAVSEFHEGRDKVRRGKQDDLRKAGQAHIDFERRARYQGVPTQISTDFEGGLFEGIELTTPQDQKSKADRMQLISNRIAESLHTDIAAEESRLGRKMTPDELDQTLSVLGPKIKRAIRNKEIENLEGYKLPVEELATQRANLDRDIGITVNGAIESVRVGRQEGQAQPDLEFMEEAGKNVNRVLNSPNDPVKLKEMLDNLAGGGTRASFATGFGHATPEGIARLKAAREKVDAEREKYAWLNEVERAYEHPEYQIFQALGDKSAFFGEAIQAAEQEHRMLSTPGIALTKAPELTPEAGAKVDSVVAPHVDMAGQVKDLTLIERLPAQTIATKLQIPTDAVRGLRAILGLEGWDSVSEHQRWVESVMPGTPAPTVAVPNKQPAPTIPAPSAPSATPAARGRPRVQPVINPEITNEDRIKALQFIAAQPNKAAIIGLKGKLLAHFGWTRQNKAAVVKINAILNEFAQDAKGVVSLPAPGASLITTPYVVREARLAEALKELGVQAPPPAPETGKGAWEFSHYQYGEPYYKPVQAIPEKVVEGKVVAPGAPRDEKGASDISLTQATKISKANGLPMPPKPGREPNEKEQASFDTMPDDIKAVTTARVAASMKEAWGEEAPTAPGKPVLSKVPKETTLFTPSNDYESLYQIGPATGIAIAQYPRFAMDMVDGSDRAKMQKMGYAKWIEGKVGPLLRGQSYPIDIDQPFNVGNQVEAIRFEAQRRGVPTVVVTRDLGNGKFYSIEPVTIAEDQPAPQPEAPKPKGRGRKAPAKLPRPEPPAPQQGEENKTVAPLNPPPSAGETRDATVKAEIDKLMSMIKPGPGLRILVTAAAIGSLLVSDASGMVYLAAAPIGINEEAAQIAAQVVNVIRAMVRAGIRSFRDVATHMYEIDGKTWMPYVVDAYKIVRISNPGLSSDDDIREAVKTMTAYFPADAGVLTSDGKPGTRDRNMARRIVAKATSQIPTGRQTAPGIQDFFAVLDEDGLAAAIHNGTLTTVPPSGGTWSDGGTEERLPLLSDVEAQKQFDAKPGSVIVKISVPANNLIANQGGSVFSKEGGPFQVLSSPDDGGARFVDPDTFLPKAGPAPTGKIIEAKKQKIQLRNIPNQTPPPGEMRRKSAKEAVQSGEVQTVTFEPPPVVRRRGLAAIEIPREAITFQQWPVNENGVFQIGVDPLGDTRMLVQGYTSGRKLTEQEEVLFSFSLESRSGVDWLKWDEFITWDHDKFTEEAFKHGFSSSKHLAMAIGRRKVKNDGKLFEVIQAYRAARLRSLRGDRRYTMQADFLANWQKHYATESDFLTVIMGATGTGYLGMAVRLDPVWNPGLKADFNIQALSEERYEDTDQLLRSSAPLTDHVFATPPDPVPQSSLVFFTKHASEPAYKAEFEARPAPVPSYKKFSTLRSASIEAIASVASDPTDASERMAKLGPNPGESAYFHTLYPLLAPLVDRIITNDMRTKARDAAIAAGFTPALAEGASKAQKAFLRETINPKDTYPRLVKAPLNSPIGDRLFRKLHVLKNGTRTIAIEILRLAKTPEEEKARVDLIWNLFFNNMVLITPEEAAKQDHIVGTSNGKFVGFYGWKGTVDKATKDSLYEHADTNPSPQNPAIRTDYRPRIVWRHGIEKMVDEETLIDSRDWQELPKETEEMIARTRVLMEELDDSVAGQQLYRDFQFDLLTRDMAIGSDWYGGWFNPQRPASADPQDNDASPDDKHIRYDINDSLTSRFFMKHRHKFAMSEVKTDEKGKTYVIAQIPGVTMTVDVPVIPGMTEDAVYNQFIHVIVNAMTLRAAQWAVNVKMKIPMEYDSPNISVMKQASDRKRMMDGDYQIGDMVTIKHEGTVKKAKIVATRKAPLITYQSIAPQIGALSQIAQQAGITDLQQAVTGQRDVFDVELDYGVVRPGKGVVKVTNLTTGDMRPAPTRSGLEVLYGKKEIYRKAKFEKPEDSKADPGMFENEPLGHSELLGYNMKHLYLLLRSAPELRKTLGKIWTDNYTLDELSQVYLRLGGDPLRLTIRESAPDDDTKGIWEDLDIVDDVITEKDKEEGKVRVKRFTKGRLGENNTLYAREAGLLAWMIQKQFASIYTPIAALAQTNMRIKAVAGRQLLAAVVPKTAEEMRDVPPAYRDTFKQIKQQQARPPSQKKILDGVGGLDVQKYLPPFDRTKPWRLVPVNERDKAGMPEYDYESDLLHQMSLGKILVEAHKSGTLAFGGHTLETTKDGSESSAKTFTPIPVEAFFTIKETINEKGNTELTGQIQFHDGKQMRTAYVVDMQTLMDSGVASKQTHRFTFKDAKGEEREQEITVWYVNPAAVANSGRAKSGIGAWSKSESPFEAIMSIEDFFDHIGQRLPDPSLISVNVDEDGGQYISPIEIDPSLETFIQRIEAHPEGRALIMDMDTIPIEDTAFWGHGNEGLSYIALDRAIRALIPNYEAVKEDEKTEQMVKAIDNAIQRYAERRFSGWIGSVTTKVPTTADVDPRLIGVEFKGRQQLLELLNNPGSGIQEDQRNAAIGLLQYLPDEIVDSFTMQILQGDQIGNRERRIFYGGSFSHALRLARIIGGQGDTTAIAEEIAHAAAQFLPADQLVEVESYRQKEIERLKANPNADAAQLSFLSWLESRGGSATSQQFVAAQRLDWMPFYGLINTDEFFARNFVASSARANKYQGMSRIRQWFHAWLNRFVTGVKAWLGDYGVQRDAYFDRLLKQFMSGDFNVTANGGYLSDINAFSDIASAWIAFRPTAFGRLQNEPEARGAVQRQNLATVVSGSFSTIHSTMETMIAAYEQSFGEKFTSKAKGMVMFTNAETMLNMAKELMPTLTPTGYDAMKATMPSDELRNQAILSAAAAVHDVEKNYNRIETKLKAQAEFVKSEQFTRLLNDMNRRSQRMVNREIIANAIEGQINQTINALMGISMDRGATREQFESARRDLAFLNKANTYLPGIVQLMEVMTDALAKTPEGFALLESPVAVSPEAFEQAWLDTNPPMEFRPTTSPISNDPQFIKNRAATMLLSMNSRLRTKMAAFSYSKEAAIMAGLPGFAAQLTTKILGSKSGLEIARAMRINIRNFTALEKAKRIFLETESRVEVELEKLQALEQANWLMKSLMLEPTYQRLRSQIVADTGERYIPRAWAHFGLPEIGSEVIVPMPSKTKRTGNREQKVITFTGDKTAWLFSLNQAEQAATDIQGYMSTLNPTSLEYLYFAQWMEFLKMIQYSTQFNDLGRNELFGLKAINTLVVKLTQHIEGTLNMYGSRYTQILKSSVRAWSDIYQLMENRWRPKHFPLIDSAIKHAVRSHPEMDQRGKVNMGVKQWYDEVGRELGGWMSRGREFRPGDILPIGGVKVTAEDIEVFKIQSRAIDEAMSYDIVRGRNVLIPPALRTDEWVPGYVYERRNMKLYPWMLVKRFNPNAIDFTSSYVRTLDLHGQQRANDLLLDPQLHTAVLWFLADRQSGWASDTMNWFYAAAADEIRAGRIKSIAELLTFLDYELAQLGSLESQPRMGGQIFLDEFNALMRRVHSATVRTTEEESPADVRPRYHENAFTTGTKNLIAPGWWYDWGMKDSADILNFSLSGSSQYFNNFKQAIQSVITMLSQQQEELSKMITQEAAMTGTSLAQAGRALRSAKRRQVKGQSIDLTYEEVSDLKAALEMMAQEMSEIFSPHHVWSTVETRPINRVTGVMVGAVLATPVGTMRNITQGAFAFNAGRQVALGRSLMKAVGWSGWQTIKRIAYAAAVLPIATAFSLTEIEYRSAATNIAGIFGKKSQGKWRPVESILKLEADIIAPMFQSMINRAVARTRNQAVLRQRGMIIDYNLRQILYNHAEAITTGGITSAKDIGVDPTGGIETIGDWFNTFLKASWGLAEFHLVAISKLMPQVGDIIANIAVFNGSISVLEDMEAHLRRRFLMKKDGGLPILIGPNALQPIDILPRWTFMRGETTLNNVKDWFTSSGIDLKGTIDRFYAALQNTPQDQWKNIKWLSPEEVEQLGQENVEAINLASPKNRPLQAKKDTIRRIMFQLMGWPINMFSKMSEWVSASLTHGPINRRIAKFIMLAMMMLLGNLGEMGLEEILRQLNWYADDEIRGTRQPWDVSGSRVINEILIDSATIWPIYATPINFALAEGPTKRSYNPTLLVQNQMMAYANYFAGVWNSGSWGYGLDTLLKSQVPVSRTLLNHLPGLSGRVEAMNVRRLLSRYGESDLLRDQKFGAMTGSFATTLTPYMDRMVNAAMHEDYGELASLYSEAVEVAMGEGLSQEEAQKKVQQGFANRNAYTRAYKSQLSATQKARLFGKMSDRERALTESYERKFGAAASMIGANTRFVEEEPGPTLRSRGRGRFGRSRFGRTRMRVVRGRLGRRLTSRITRL